MTSRLRTSINQRNIKKNNAHNSAPDRFLWFSRVGVETLWKHLIGPRALTDRRDCCRAPANAVNGAGATDAATGTVPRTLDFEKFQQP
jgi:hypothetical protein